MTALSALRKDRGVSTHEHKHSYEQEEETQKEDGADHLPGPETILDYTDAVLAMGAGWRGGQDRGTTVDRTFQTRARGVAGVVE